jgi:DNA-directed RNA polymerase specialized sigma24 family protein
VQEVFIEALEGMHSVRDSAAIKGWSSVIAVRVARRKLHMRKMRAWFFRDKESDEGAIERLASDGASPEQRALMAAVFRVLEFVPVAERLAWTLPMIEGEPIEEVARLCDCSLASAKRRVAAAQAAAAEPGASARGVRRDRRGARRALRSVERQRSHGACARHGACCCATAPCSAAVNTRSICSATGRLPHASPSPPSPRFAPLFTCTDGERGCARSSRAAELMHPHTPTQAFSRAA